MPMVIAGRQISYYGGMNKNKKYGVTDMRRCVNDAPGLVKADVE